MYTPAAGMLCTQDDKQVLMVNRCSLSPGGASRGPVICITGGFPLYPGEERMMRKRGVKLQNTQPKHKVRAKCAQKINIK